MTRRLIAVCLTVAVLCTCMAAPVSAAEDDATTVELLEYSTVNDSGDNMFYFTTQTTVALDVPQYTRLRYIDMLISTSDNVAPTKVEVRYNSVYTALTIKEVEAGLYRVYGTISGYFDEIYLRFTASGSQYITILSCEVSTLKANLFYADADLYFSTSYDYTAVNGYYEQSSVIKVPSGDNLTSYEYVARVEIYDWQLYDSVTVWGSVDGGTISSVRATLDGESIPVTSNFMNTDTGDVYESIPDVHWTNGENAYYTVYGKSLYSFTVDTSQLNPTQASSILLIYFTGTFNGAQGFDLTYQYCTGSVEVADTTNATWWTKFTNFMNSLFGTDKQDEADNQSATIESQVSDMESAMDEMNSVTKPDIGDINVDAGTYVDPEAMTTTGNVLNEFMANEMVLTMMLIAATVGLGAFIVF